MNSRIQGSGSGVQGPREAELVTVNIGNTHTTFCYWQNDTKYAVVAEASDISPRVFQTMTSKADQVVIASVVPAKRSTFKKALKHRARDVHIFRDTLHPEIEIIPDPPENVGDDRVAAALGALSIEAASPWVVVDAGTALTCNAVTPAIGGKLPRFEGGLIVPGIQLSLKALNKNTAQLPDLSRQIGDGSNLSFIGRSTEEAMLWGVAISHISTVLMMIEGQRAALGPRTRVVITGGGATALKDMLRLSPLPNADFMFQPALVHMGLRAAWKAM